MKSEKASRLYHSIGEVAALTGVKAHVLRYWEAEFPTLRPRKTSSGSRRYRQQDIDEILAIKKLLYEEGFKIAGARKMRRAAHRKTPQPAKAQLSLGFEGLDAAGQLEAVKEELREILQLLKNPEL